MSSHSPVPASGLIVFPSRKRASKLPEGLLFSSASACKLSDQHLSEHAALFSAHYGTWGSRGPHPGQRVKMGLQGLRAQSASDSRCFVSAARKSVDGSLVGHAFFTVAPAATGPVLWVTQLVVHGAYRSQGVAQRLLSSVTDCALAFGVKAIGMASTHPHAIRALAGALHCRTLDSNFMKAHLRGVLSDLQVQYLRLATRSSVEAGPDSEPFCADHSPAKVVDTTSDGSRPTCLALIKTDFYVDHSEPNAALAEDQTWPLGTLQDGCEFVVLFDLADSCLQTEQMASLYN